MARKRITPVKDEVCHYCRECRHSYDWSDPSYVDGTLILCKCQHYKQGRWYKFLNDRHCEKFEPR